MPRFSVRNAIVLVNLCLLVVLFIHLKTVWDKDTTFGTLFGDDEDGYDGANADDRDAVLGLNSVKSDSEWKKADGKKLQVNGASKGDLKGVLKKERRTAVVVASQASENATWLEEFFPHWEQNVYRVDDTTAKLTVPKNKGRESMVYLT